MSFGLRDEMMNLKSKLENLEGELTNQMMELEVKAEEWHTRDEQAKELAKKNKDLVVTLDVGGKKFVTKLETLISIKDTLFYKIFLDGKLDIKSEIFIDRSYEYFPFILSYMRNKKLIDTCLSRDQFDGLLDEAQFYHVQELIDLIEEMNKEVKYVGFESSGVYTASGRIAGTNVIQDLNDFEDRSMTKGICAISPGWITIELTREFEFEEIEVAGWNGNTTIWGASNGANCPITTSTDKVNWTSVGSLPSSFSATITTVKLIRSKAKWIKFNHNSYLGLGFLKIKKL